MLLSLLLCSCGWDQVGYEREIDRISNSALQIEVLVPKQYGSNVLITDKDKISEITNWLRKATLSDAQIASYPGTPVSFNILLNNGRVIKFYTNQPTLGFKSTLIVWQGVFLFAPPFPESLGWTNESPSLIQIPSLP